MPREQKFLEHRRGNMTYIVLIFTNLLTLSLVLNVSVAVDNFKNSNMFFLVVRHSNDVCKTFWLCEIKLLACSVLFCII